MSETHAHPPQAIMKGWLNPGNGITNESYVKMQARNIAICRSNDAGTELKVIARQHSLHNSSVTRILAENGRKPNVNPTPAGAQDIAARPPQKISKPVASFDPSVTRTRENSKALLKAILRMAVRTDTLIPGMTYDEMRDRCFEHGVAFPA